MAQPPTRRIYLEVPYPEKGAAKHLGAWWDGEAKAWYIPAGKDPAPFLKRWPRIAGDPALDRPVKAPSDSYDAKGKLLAAKVMGRLGGIAGGRKGGKARAEALSPERRREIALMGVQAREQKRATERAAKALQVQERRRDRLDSFPTRPGPRPEEPDADDSVIELELFHLSSDEDSD